MANVYVEARPKGRPEGSYIDDYVVEDYGDHVLGTFKTQREAINWAKTNGHAPLVARVRNLNDKKKPHHWRADFTGTILRIEPNGFGIVRFDAPVGPSANAYGVFSTTLGSTAPYQELKPGVHVVGTATPESDTRKLATVLDITLA